MNGKGPVVTWRATSILAAISRMLCEPRASLIILNRNTEAMDAAVSALVKTGHQVSFHCCEVAAEADGKSVAGAVVQTCGAVHTLV